MSGHAEYRVLQALRILQERASKPAGKALDQRAVTRAARILRMP